MRTRNAAATKLAIAMAAGALSAAASAESNVTLYGLVDAGVRYSNNNVAGDGTNDNELWQLRNGALNPSRFGLKGSEELGSGIRGVFTLEAGFDPSNGALTKSNVPNTTRLFAREASVGFGGEFGAFTVGRQTGATYDAVAAFDPLNWGGIDSVAWHSALTGTRFDRTAKFHGDALGLKYSLLYGFGDSSNDHRSNETYGGTLGWSRDPLTLIGGYQETRDDAKHRARNWTAGGTFGYGNSKLYAGYIDSRLDSGFGLSSWVTQSNSPPAAQSLTYQDTGLWVDVDGQGRHDQMYLVGISAEAAPKTTLTIGYMNDRVTNVPQEFRRETIYGVADYALSKRTDAYLLVDYNRNSNDVPLQRTLNSLPASQSQQTGAMVGVRHRF